MPKHPISDDRLRHMGPVHFVGFDNERGKGGHCHVGDRERAYAFVSVEQLVEDFIAAVDAARSGK